MRGCIAMPVRKVTDSIPLVELRGLRRQRVLWPGLIFVPRPHSTFDCSIRDLSETGARIAINGDALIPTEFLLIDIKNRDAYEVQRVRRNNLEMGLKILRTISLDEASSPEARGLRRLLIERLHR